MQAPLLICIDPSSITSLNKNNLEKNFLATNEKRTYKGGSSLSEQIVPILVLGISFYNHRCFPPPQTKILGKLMTKHGTLVWSSSPQGDHAKDSSSSFSSFSSFFSSSPVEDLSRDKRAPVSVIWNLCFWMQLEAHCKVFFLASRFSQLELPLCGWMGGLWYQLKMTFNEFNFKRVRWKVSSWISPDWVGVRVGKGRRGGLQPLWVKCLLFMDNDESVLFQEIPGKRWRMCLELLGVGLRGSWLCGEQGGEKILRPFLVFCTVLEA